MQKRVLNLAFSLVRIFFRCSCQITVPSALFEPTMLAYKYEKFRCNLILLCRNENTHFFTTPSISQTHLHCKKKLISRRRGNSTNDYFSFLLLWIEPQWINHSEIVIRAILEFTSSFAHPAIRLPTIYSRRESVRENDDASVCYTTVDTITSKLRARFLLHVFAEKSRNNQFLVRVITRG